MSSHEASVIHNGERRATKSRAHSADAQIGSKSNTKKRSYTIQRYCRLYQRLSTPQRYIIEVAISSLTAIFLRKSKSKVKVIL